jgi:hypothetical protein
MKKYKYLVTCGCSQTYGQGCPANEVYGKHLADKLGLELINIATAGTGWYSVETTITSFIHNNKNILNECFFVLQKSALDRRVNYEEIAICRTDVWEKWNMKYMSPINIAFHGFNDWDAYHYIQHKPEWWPESEEEIQHKGMWTDPNNVNKQLIYFPEHKHYPNSRHGWKIGIENDIYPPLIHEQFQELMLHWGLRMNSFHLFLKSLNIDHIMVDGYSPFLSYKLDFTNYYDTDDEFEWVKEFWSTSTNGIDVDDSMIYDFKNTEAGWIFDSIDSKYKIDDVILWSLYQFKTHGTEYNVDGGHAGPAGMKLIADVLYKNLINKGWFDEIHN